MAPASCEDDLTRDMMTILTEFLAGSRQTEPGIAKDHHRDQFLSIARQAMNKPEAKAIKTLILPLLDADTGKR
jgi:hypothetical protein